MRGGFVETHPAPAQLYRAVHLPRAIAYGGYPAIDSALAALVSACVKDGDYLQRVRRHSPQALVPLVATFGARFALPGKKIERVQGITITPWALADVARVSLVHSNPWRKDATERDVIECCWAYNDIEDPDLADHGHDAAAKYLLRTSCEQFVHQHVGLNNMARSAALFLETAPVRPLRVLIDDWELRLFGWSLADFIGVGLLVHITAYLKGGRFNPDWIYQEGMEKVTNLIPREMMTQILAQFYIADMQTFRELNQRNYQEGPYRRYSYNPLSEVPIITGLADDLLIPVPGMLMFRYSTLGIYHLGMRTWGPQFAEDVGSLFEAYIGRQLALVAEGMLYPAIKYGRDHRESVDWILVLDDAVLLVEVKSVRPTNPVRIGADAAKTEMSRMLRRAFEQLATTNKCIDQGVAEFAEVPADRPRFGLIVTLEDFWVANTFMHRDWYAPHDDESSIVVSAEELEHLVLLPAADITAKLTKLTTSAEVKGWHVGALIDESDRRNPVIDSAWKALPWHAAFNAEQQHQSAPERG